MHLFDISFPSPEENLAYDDALLDYMETDAPEPILRIWQPASTFVVLGHGNKINTEVNLNACLNDNVPVFRRQSGGGTILQGKGVLNYSVILPLNYHHGLHSITSTNTFIMSTIAEGLKRLDSRVAVNGITDIVLGTKKIVGNAQRRKRHSVLFHGCILVALDLSLISKYLSHPSVEPEYRQSRSHDDFLTHFAYPVDTIKEVLIKQWNATIASPLPLSHEIKDKIECYYAQNEWNFKF